MRNTGVMATAEQVRALKAALNRPVMFLDGGISMGGSESPQQLCHRFALQQGLTEISGYYGLRLNKDGTGEFVTD